MNTTTTGLETLNKEVVNRYIQYALERAKEENQIPDIGVWFKNGDHPNDYAKTVDGFENGELVSFSPEHQKANDWGGQVVRRYRHPSVAGEKPCQHCGAIMHLHGWIDQGDEGLTVCPRSLVLSFEGKHEVIGVFES